jgi:hypothetical protein
MNNPTPLVAREVYMQESFLTLENFKQLRDKWREMLDHCERMLDHFMQNLPANYRSRRLPYQPDAVWGERVLPNFRCTMDVLEECYIERLNNIDNCMIGVGLEADVNGQREYDAGWMDEVEPLAAAKYYALLFEASAIATPMDKTMRGSWDEGDLTTGYAELRVHGIFRDLPEFIPPADGYPIYRLNPDFTMKSGEITPKTGFYLPDVPHSFPTLQIAVVDDEGDARTARRAMVTPYLLPDGTETHYKACTWTLIERIADSGGGDGLTPSNTVWRAKEGEICPQTGDWWSPAYTAAPKKHFEQGDVMSDVPNNHFGAVIWYLND